MGDFLNEDPVDFWKRPELEQSGAFAEGAKVLEGALAKYKGHLQPAIIDSNEVLQSPNVVFQNDYTGRKKNPPTAKACAFIDRRTNKTYFALDPDTSNPEMHRFEVTSSGHLLNLDKFDGFGESFGSADKDIQLFSAAVGKIKQSLYSAECRERDRQAGRRRTIARWTIGVTAISLIGGGTALGLKEWYFDPRAEDKAARQAFDAEEHVLDTQPVPIQSREVEAIPSSDFDEIPEFKEDDNFRSPRTIEIEGNDCETEKISTKPGDTVRVGLEEGDPLIGSTIGVSVDDDRKYVTICLMGPDSPEGDNGGAEKSELAVQVLSSEQH